MNNLPSENVRSFIKDKDTLTKEEKNRLINFHNTAVDDKMYGDRLYAFSKDLVQKGKLQEGDEDRILIYSVEWPVDIQLDYV